MAVYHIKELLDALYLLIQDGFDYAELSPKNSEPASLSVTGRSSAGESRSYELASCTLGDDCGSDSDDENCYQLPFTYDEMATIASALANVSGIYEKAIHDERYDPREREAFLAMQEKAHALNEKIKLAFQNCK